MVAFDVGTGKVWFGKNGTWNNSGVPASGTGYITTVTAGTTLGPIWGNMSSGLTSSGYFNFGQRAFDYTPPTGFKALCTQNLPVPTIINPNQYFDVNTRAGTAGAGSVTGKKFQPDFVWSKSRSARDHGLANSVRGAGKRTSTNLISAEVSDAQELSTFNSDGFSFGTTQGVFNYNGENFVDWMWKKGATPGLDIVYVASASASAVNHSLGVKPSMMWVRDIAGGHPWFTHKSMATNMNDVWMDLYQNIGTQTFVGAWGGEPTATQFYASNAFVITGHSYFATLFAEVPGFSKFGIYPGNASTNGPFIWCGFRPAFVLVKYTGTESPAIFDIGRSPTNVNVPILLPMNNNADSNAYNTADMLSNGFKMRTSTGWGNDYAGNFVFAAFAEVPFKYALAR